MAFKRKNLYLKIINKPIIFSRITGITPSLFKEVIEKVSNEMTDFSNSIKIILKHFYIFLKCNKIFTDSDKYFVVIRLNLDFLKNLCLFEIYVKNASTGEVTTMVGPEFQSAEFTNIGVC